jgi:aminoglycoside phosphotransferase (APT) family kinase protein
MRAPDRPAGSVRIPVAQRRVRRRDRVVRALAPEILAKHSESLPTSRGAVVSHAELTSTGMAVVFLARIAGEPPCAVLKMPLTAGALRGLERETLALEALHADGRLGEWRSLLPRPCVCGSIEGQAYRVDSALPGRPIPERLMAADPGGAWRAAAETIGHLHAVTATRLPDDFDRAEQWVDTHLRELESRSAWRGPMLVAAERLRDELHAALADWTGKAAAIHGDYWLGNLLFAEGGAPDQTPAGIVDWDAWAPLELPLHDLVHLLLHTRGLRTRRELGDLVVRQLREPEWTSQERQVLDRWDLGSALGSLAERHALLLYWLRQTAMHARQQPRQIGYRYRVWERRNVLSVLAAL